MERGRPPSRHIPAHQFRATELERDHLENTTVIVFVGKNHQGPSVDAKISGDGAS